MVHCHRFLLAQSLWTVLLLAGTTNRLPAQEQVLGSVSEGDQSQAKTAEVVSLPEITGKTSPTTELKAPGLEQLLSHLGAFRKAHTPFHIRHREVIKLRNASEVKAIESMDLPPGMLLDTEYESAFWDNRSWKRCLSRGVDGEPASDKRSSGDCEGTAGLDVPFALLGVFIEPKPENCKLTFDDVFPHITITSDEHNDHIELWMFPVSGHWIPKRLRSSPEDKDELGVEWEVHHIKAFGKDRPPQIIDGEVRWTVRNGGQETTITSEFFITKALYGDDVVPGEIDPSLAPMPAAAVAPVVDAPVMNTPAASNGPQFRARSPKVIVIETTPDIDRSEVIRKVVEAMENDGRAKRGDIERVGKSVGLEAILSPVHDMSQEKIVKLIEVLQSLGVDRMRFSANNEQKESTVIIQCPADIAWRKVRTMTEELEKTGDFKVDVRVAASDEPVTPVAVESLPNPNRVPPILPGAEELPSPSKLQDGFSPLTSRPTPETSERGELKVFSLRNIQAKEAGRIIEQLYITTPGGHDSFAIRLSVDDRNNSLIVRGDSAVVAEVEALLLRLDTKQSEPNPADSSNASGGDDAGIRVNVPALGPEPLALDFSVPVSSAQGQTFSFSIGVPGQNADDLQRQYEALEQRTLNLSDELRKPLPDPGKGEELKSQIRDAVKQAFEARQKIQRAELAEFAQRLKGIQESIELRDKISQQIIDRRVEELLDPNLKWDEAVSGSGRAPALRSDTLSSRNERTTQAVSRRAATTSRQGLDGSPDDSRHSPDDFDPADQVQFLLWNSLGIACRPDVFPFNQKVGAAQSFLLVTRVRPESPAALSDLRVNDFIISEPNADNPSNLLDQWRESFASRSLKLKIQAGDRVLDRVVLWPENSVEPGVLGEWRLKTIYGEGGQSILQGLRLESSAVPTNEANDSFGVWTLQNSNHASRLLVKMNTETHQIDLGSINDRGEVSDRSTGIWKLEGDELHVAFASNAKSPQRPADFTGKIGLVQVWRRTTTQSAKAPTVSTGGSLSGAGLPAVESKFAGPEESKAAVPKLSEFAPGYKPKSHEETAFAKLVLVFFQDRSRRAVPCVIVKINEEYFAVATGPATVVPDGTTHAIDRSVVEWSDGSEATVTYDERSTKELHLYRFADDAVIPEPQRSAAEMKIDKIPVSGFDPRLDIGVALSALTPVGPGAFSETRVRVSAINVSQNLTLPSHKVEHQYDGLFAVDAALPEGTPVFLDGKLMGLTLLGSRFVGEEAQRSFVLPASRLWEKLRNESEVSESVAEDGAADDTTPVLNK